MPVLSTLTADQQNALRSGGWASEIRFAVTPNTVVWQATVNQTISNSSFIQFLWDGNLQGAYTAAVAGMTYFLTATSDPDELRNPLVRGRVARAPTSTIFYCNETAINLTDGMILTVIANFEILQMDRIGNLVDGYQTFQDLLPIVKNMQSFYYGESATSFQFSFAPVGQAMTEGATIASYAWSIAGATYNVGSASTQNITVTVTAGHRWAYLTVTDSGGRALVYKFEILVCDRDNATYMYTAHDDVTINGSVENGWNVSTTYFAGVENLLNRTRCAIVVFDHPKAGATNLFSNVAFVGYFVEETTEIAGDAASSTLSQTNFELQSYAAIAGQLPVPSLPIRNDPTPDEWGDINLPTPQRAISYLLSRYSTFATLCAMDMGSIDSTWFAGEMDLEEGTLLDSVNRIGEEIQARLVFFPQGDATFEINANFLSTSERDALSVLIPSGALGAGDLFRYSLPIPYYKTVGQVIAGCATFYTNGTTTPIKLEAIAPATARQEGNEKPVILAQLLAANLSSIDAVTAAKQRGGDLLEYMNPGPTIPCTLVDGWHILTPSTRVWLNFDLPATDSTRGVAVVSTDRWTLQSVTCVWGVDDGTWGVQGLARLETRGGLAQQGATISPNVINTDLPVLPILSDYDAFVADGSLNYADLEPIDADRQPFTPFDLGQYTPMTTEDAANAADNTPGAGCVLLNPPVNFKSNVSRATPNITTLGQLYDVYVKGEARIATGTWQEVFFPDSNGSFSPTPTLPYGTYVPGSPGHWTTTDALALGNYRRSIDIERTGIPSTAFTFVSVNYDWTGGSFSGPIAFVVDIGATRIWEISNTDLTNGTNLVESWSGSVTDTSLRIALNSSVSVTAVYSGSAQFNSLTVRGTGTNPFTGEVGGELFADAFYTYGKDDDGNPIDVQLNSGGGLYQNGSPIGVPPAFNPNHEYQYQFTGDGNVVPFVFYDTDYTDNQNLILYIKVCGPGMGS